MNRFLKVVVIAVVVSVASTIVLKMFLGESNTMLVGAISGAVAGGAAVAGTRGSASEP